MKAFLLTATKKLFSDGERQALRALQTELQISFYHRRGLKLIRSRNWSRPAKLNLGSGYAKKEGYLNVDLFPGGDLTLDLRRGLPFDSGCCETIFSEHFFEHVDYPNPIYHLFGECFRVLKPGGGFRFSVPETEAPLSEYPLGMDSPYVRACREQDWGHPSYCSTPLEHINYHFRQGTDHRFAYDEETARKILETCGFYEIRREAFAPSLDSEHRELGSLFMSARKPA